MRHKENHMRLHVCIHRATCAWATLPPSRHAATASVRKALNVMVSSLPSSWTPKPIDTADADGRTWGVSPPVSSKSKQQIPSDGL